MSIGIIPKKPAIKTSYWINFLFFFSIAFLLVIVGAYFFLNRSEKQLQEELLYLDKVAEYEEVAFKEDERFINQQERKIKDFGYLINMHLDSSNFFSHLETVIHPEVWFSKITLDIDNLEVFLSGHAQSFVVLGQQILILEKDILKEHKTFKEIKLSNLALGEEGVVFDLQISLSPKIFIIQ